MGNALLSSCRDGSPAVRREFCVSLAAPGRAHHEHQEHPRSAQGRLQDHLGHSLKSNDVQGEVSKPPMRKKSSPNCADDACVRGTRVGVGGCATYRRIISAMGQAARPARAARP